MSGTIVVDRIESDASYASSINIASPLIISNTVNMNLDGAAQVFNRTTSVGDILQFKKDGTTVGSIGTPFANALHITGPGSNGAGLVFQENDIIAPARNGARSADTQDLGNSLFRFKDLYLSGSVYLGGTGAANALDDYEEGTWTPDLRFGGGTTAITYGARGGRYTKVGNVVYFTMRITLSNKGSSTGAAQIFGLPFPVGSTGNSADYSGASLAYSSGTVGWDVTLQPTLDTNSSYIFMRYNNGTGNVDMTNGNFANNTDVILFGFYFA